MKQPIRTAAWLLLGMLVAGSFLADVTPGKARRSRLTSFPLQGPGFKSMDVPLNDAEATVFKNSTVLKRVCQTSEGRFALFAVDGGHDRHALHDPLYCFRGAGWVVQTESFLAIPGGSARHLALVKGSQRAQALYWITDGVRRHASNSGVWIQSILRRLHMQGKSMSPVLIVLQPLDEAPLDLRAVAAHFQALYSI